MGSDPYFKTADDRKIIALEQQAATDDETIHTLTQRILELESVNAVERAKLWEAEAACAEMQSILRTSLAIPRAWMGVHITFEQWDKACQKVFQAIDTPNPGAHLLARLKAADELEEASAQILRACASSVPRVFSNAQFALGEKLEAYKTAKEAG